MNRTDRLCPALAGEYGVDVDHLIADTSQRRWKQERQPGGHLP